MYLLNAETHKPSVGLKVKLFNGINFLLKILPDIVFVSIVTYYIFFLNVIHNILNVLLG